MYQTERRCFPYNINTSLIIGILFIGNLCSLYGLVFYIDGILPTPIQLADENKYPCEFIAERAQINLEKLISIGPRTVGSLENEKSAVDFLKNEVSAIQNGAHLNHTIELDVQLTSGTYFYSKGNINSYGNVQNVIVKLHSKNDSKHSLLINAHFNSFPTSPGGSDDGINCVIMLEVLRKITTTPIRPEHNIIFLFNGAIEASHGFITQHKWAKEVKAFINLDAVGVAGKEMLFQTGPSSPWLLKYYQQVPYPNGQVAYEDIFQTAPFDIVSDDFITFQNAVGLGMAFTRDGYRYHTKYDGFPNIPIGSYQHAGANLLSLVRNLGSAPEINDVQATHGVIFFDLFGFFFIYYSPTVAMIMYSVTCSLSFIVTILSFYNLKLIRSFSSFIYVCLTLITLLLGCICAVVLVYGTAVLLDFVNYTMTWYRSPWIIFGLYVTPIILICCTTLVLFNRYFKKDMFRVNEKVQIQLHLVRIIWTIFLLTGTFLAFRFIYLIFIPLIFQTLAFVLILILGLQSSIKKWLPVYLIGTILPNLFLFHQSLQINAIMIPAYGRMGVEINPEVHIALIVAVLTIAITFCYIPLITLVSKSQILLLILSFIYILFFIIVFTPLGFSYDGNVESPAPQRLLVYHTSRVSRDYEDNVYIDDSGFLLVPLDRNGPNTISKCLKGASFTSLHDDCESILFCGLPMGWQKEFSIEKSSWIQASEKPIINEPIKFILYSKKILNSTSTHLSFLTSGPPNMEIYVSPQNEIKITSFFNYNISSTSSTNWNGRSVFKILHTWGVRNTPLKFNVELSHPPNWHQPLIEIAVVGKYVNDEINIKGFEYKELLSQFPDWVDVLPFVGVFESWIY